MSPARPPHYSLYTLLSLGDTFIALYVILCLHILALAIVKWATVPSFRQFNAFNNFVHILENVNLPSPHQVQIIQYREFIIHLVIFQLFVYGYLPMTVIYSIQANSTLGKIGKWTWTDRVIYHLPHS